MAVVMNRGIFIFITVVLMAVSTAMFAAEGGQSGQGQGQGQGDQDRDQQQSEGTGVPPSTGDDSGVPGPAVGDVVIPDLPMPEDKNVIKFKSRVGNVTFQHKLHADLKITQCNTCHHKMMPEDTVVKPCHECHKKKAKDPEPPKTIKAFHDRCAGCHEYTIAGGSNAGPILKKCKLCHIKTAKKKK